MTTPSLALAVLSLAQNNNQQTTGTNRWGDSDDGKGRRRPNVRGKGKNDGKDDNNMEGQALMPPLCRRVSKATIN
jgi:hypothetical protein